MCHPLHLEAVQQQSTVQQSTAVAVIEPYYVP